MRVEKILLVDDDNITNDINKYLIGKLGMGNEVKVLKNGQEALEYLRDPKNIDPNSPPLVFLDLNMPVMDGKEFLREFESKADQLPSKPVIVVLSTTILPQEIKEVEEHPAVMGRIEKPLTAEKLQRAILAYTEYSSNRSEEEV